MLSPILYKPVKNIIVLMGGHPAVMNPLAHRQSFRDTDKYTRSRQIHAMVFYAAGIFVCKGHKQ